MSLNTGSAVFADLKQGGFQRLVDLVAADNPGMAARTKAMLGKPAAECARTAAAAAAELINNYTRGEPLDFEEFRSKLLEVSDVFEALHYAAINAYIVASGTGGAIVQTVMPGAPPAGDDPNPIQPRRHFSG